MGFISPDTKKTEDYQTPAKTIQNHTLSGTILGGDLGEAVSRLHFSLFHAGEKGLQYIDRQNAAADISQWQKIKEYTFWRRP